MPEVTNTISWPVFSALAAIFTVLVMIFKLVYGGGGRAQTIDNAVRRVGELEECIRKLKADRTNDREKDRVSLEGNLAALHGGHALLKDQLSEFRSHVTAGFATKSELHEVEKRAEASRDRIFATIDQIGERLDSFLAKIIDAQKTANRS